MSSDFPERADEAMASLGIETDESQLPPSAGLDEVRARIQSDLERTQGPYRRAGAFERYWPFGLAAVFAGILAVLLQPAPGAGWPKLVATLSAGLAGVVCLLAAGLAPSRPGAGERLATLGLMAAGLALVVEGVVAISMPRAGVQLGGGCAMTMAASAVLPLLAIFFGLKRAGLPVRRLHAAACAAAALALVGATVWLHCPAENVWHVMNGHIAIPAVIAVGLSAALFTMFTKVRSGRRAEQS